MTMTCTSTTRLRVIGEYNEYWVTVHFVVNLHISDPSESVSWDGTGEIYKDSKGQHYINRHSGNSQHYEYAYAISDDWANKFIEAADSYEDTQDVLNTFTL